MRVALACELEYRFIVVVLAGHELLRAVLCEVPLLQLLMRILLPFPVLSGCNLSRSPKHLRPPPHADNSFQTISTRAVAATKSQAKVLLIGAGGMGLRSLPLFKEAFEAVVVCTRSHGGKTDQKARELGLRVEFADMSDVAKLTDAFKLTETGGGPADVAYIMFPKGYEVCLWVFCERSVASTF